MPKRDYHVVTQNGARAGRREGSERVSSTHDTQAAAIQGGRPLAENQGVELVIHRPNGQVRDSESYGNDPMPPRDAKH